MNPALEQLRSQSAVWGIRLSDSRLALLERYARLLGSYELANVIGTRDPEKIVTEHLLDSLSCFLTKCVHEANSMIDVGTGGGLPGVPLAIVRPELRVALLEATEKKVSFLKLVQEELGLRNLELLNTRVEEVGRKPEYRETFELATGRALAALPVVAEYCAPLVRVGGTILSMKGRLSEEESSQGIAAAKQLGLELREVRGVEYQEWLPQKERRLVVFEKVAVTPHRFPRRVGLAKKRPLGS